MTVSSHLSPEPERRLWLILENVRAAVSAVEARAGLVAALAGLELALAPGARGWAAAPLLAAALVGLGAFAPVARLPRWPWLQPAGRPGVDDCLLTVDDLAKYAHGELILKLDRYLGGGVSAMPYFEDVVLLILTGARVAKAKAALVRLALAFLAVGQAALAARLLAGA